MIPIGAPSFLATGFSVRRQPGGTEKPTILAAVYMIKITHYLTPFSAIIR